MNLEKGCKMYEPFFGMERLPFSAMPDSGCFFCSSEIQSILDELTVCVERGQGIGILTASAGLGKTLLCQRLVSSLQQRDKASSQYECVYLSNSNYPTRRSLLQAVLFELGDDYSRRDESELRIDLRSRLLSLRPEREALVLIVDEAHLFADELLEELRTLSDLAYDGSSLVRIVLSGQHELEERLTGRVFDALNQRISKHVYAEPLTVSESIEYVAHRLEWAGCDIETVFSEEAVSVIARASGGVPRCLNQLADHSLLLAFASDQKPVSEDTVREALEDLKQLPLHWNDVSDGTDVVGFVEDDVVDEDGAMSLTSGQASEEAVSAEPDEDAANNVFDAQAKCLSGIVESLRGSHASAEKEVQRASVPPLDGGIELDFSHGDPVAAADDSRVDRHDDENHDVTLASDEQAETASPEVAVFEFTAGEPEDGHESADVTDSASEPECPDPGETLIQVLKPAIPETLFEQAIDRDANHKGDAPSDEGISIQITSRGLELDDFGPPEELTEAVDESPRNVEATVEPNGVDSAREQVDSGVIEFAFDQDSPGETSPANDAPAEASDDTSIETHRTVSAAEITASLLREDSPDPDAGDDVPLVEVAPEVGGNVALDTELYEQKEAVVMDATLSHGTDYEEELVPDPYAAMQEPESAGIVWNVASFAKHRESLPVTERVDGSNASADDCSAAKHNESDLSHAESESADGDGTFSRSEGSDESVARSHELLEDSSDEPQDNPVACDSEESTIDESGTEVHEHEDHETIDSRLILSAGELEFEESGVEAVSAHDDELHDDAPVSDGDVASPEVVTAETDPSAAARTVADAGLVDEADSHVDEADSHVDEPQDESREQDVESTEADYSFPLASDETMADEQDAPDEHDVVQPVEATSPQPGRIVDSIFPLLDELEDGLESVDVPGHADRSVLDIEAELIQSIKHDSDDLEDQIGAAMLDICLDTQSALQDSAAAIRNAEAAREEAAREEAAGEELEDLEDLSETHNDALTDPLDSTAPLDVVQPEPRRSDESSSYQLEPQFQEPAAEPSLPEASERQSAETRQPFGRLFSELRRRQR